MFRPGRRNDEGGAGAQTLRPATVAAGAAGGAGRTRPWDLFAGRAFSGNAVLRHTNAVQWIVILALVVAQVYREIKWFNYAAQLSEKQFVVFHDVNGETTMHTAAEFRSGASDHQINNVAWNVVRWYWEAGTKNYATAFAEARALMTPDMQEQFDQTSSSRIDELEKLSIYRKIENAHVRPLEERDLPAGAHVDITRYDVVIEGRLDTYRDNSKGELISSGPIAVYVHLIPLPQPTDQFPAGLQVAGMAMLDSKPPTKGAAEGRTPDAAASPSREANDKADVRN
jgi:hypothetical protein